MYNMVCIVGRLLEKPETTSEDSVKIIVSVPRSYKNEDGETDIDNIDCILWQGIAKNAEAYLAKGDLVGVKGRLETKDNKIIVIAEKITFLSSKKDENTGE